LSASLVLSATDLAQSSDSDLYSVLLSAWQMLLVRYTDEPDLVIGCAGVPGTAVGDDGVFVLRRAVQPQDSFRSIVKATANELRETMAAGEVSVSELLAMLGAEPGPGKHPIYQVGFAKVSQFSEEPAATTSSDHAPRDVTLRWNVDGETVVISLDYTPALFDRPRMRRMAAHLAVLLGEALAEPDQAVGRLPLLTEEGQEELRRWNATEYPHRRERPITALFDEQVRRSPDVNAVEFDDDAVSYADLERRANRLAHALRARGVGPDVTVAISMDRSVNLVVAVLAVLKAGGAYVPIDAAYPEQRRSYMLENSEAALLLVRVDAPQLPGSHMVEVLDVDNDRAAFAEFPEEPPVTETNGGHLGYVVYTSGSTGQPKGVAMPQAALTNLIEWQLRRPRFPPGARTLQFSSLSFDVSFQEILTTWCSGGTLVLVPDATRRDPRGLLDHLIRHDVERIFLPFVALRGLADAATSSGTFPGRLREVYTAGEQLQVDDTVRAFFTALPDCVLENQYGPAESHVVTAHTLEGRPASWPALPPIGGPIANSAIHILDAHGGRRPVGVPGELHIGGICLARGYLGRPDLTDERFVPHSLADDEGRLYRTGDLGRWLDDGTIEFLGRVDNQVKFRGFRIEPGEVGAVLSSFPGVRQCVATVADVEGIGPRLAAYVLPAEGSSVSLGDLHRFARDRLPDYMVPSHINVLDAFPLTPSGKVDVQGLPEPAFDRRILSTTHEGPRSAEEHAVAEIWQRLLGVEDIGVHDDFFDLGGDSLMAVEMFAIIREDFDRELPLGALAQDPTIAGLAAHLITDDTASQWGSLVPMRTEGAAPPLFCVHGGAGNVASFPRLARALPADRPAYALQWDGLDGSRGSRTIEEMARSYVQQVRRVQPSGPYFFAGQCIGGLITREMTRMLGEDGEDVALLVMYDTPNVYSRHFRPTKGLPAVPTAVQAPVNRLTGATANAARFLMGKRPRRAYLRVRLQSALRWGVPSVQDRGLYVGMVMVRAAWRYRVRPLDVPTVLIHSGRSSGLGIAMAGHWADGVMGWSEHVSPRFEVHRVRGGHNDLPYKAESVQLLTSALDAASGNA
jgi:amino acid adenylation domain-containing protein